MHTMYFRSFFRPSIFLQLQDSKIKGYLSIDTFFNYIMKKIWIDQTRNGLSQYDSCGFGYLSEAVIYLNFSILPSTEV